MLSFEKPLSLQRPLAVLLVDDDDIFLDFTAHELGRLGCEVTPVSDPHRALDMLREQPFDAVITDWQMPGMDGIELVSHVRQDGSDIFRYVVLTTAKVGPDTARAALMAGADDVLFKPLDRVQLELTIASIRRTVRLQRRLQRHNRHLANAHRRTREAFRRVEADLEAAASLHRSLLPQPQPSDRVAFAWSYLPALNLGGDTIGLVTLRNGGTLFFVADVRGHGVPAALASFHVHHRLIQFAPETPEDLCTAVAALNEEVLAQPGDTYCTLLVGLIAADGRRCSLIRAGHPQPIVAQGNMVATLDTDGGFPLGWFPGTNYAATPFTLPEDGRLVLYSDGATECADVGGEELGTAGLERLVALGRGQPIGDLVSGIEARLRARRGNLGFEDDISVLALQVRQNREFTP